MAKKGHRQPISITPAGAGEHRRQKVSSAANPVVVTGAYSGPVVRGRAIPVNSATTSAWRLHPVLARTRPSWVCTVSGDTPPSMAMSLGVRPEARDRATRASAGVRSNNDCTSSTEGACGRVMGVSTRTAKQRTKMSRAESRMGMTCATIVASASASRTGNDQTSGLLSESIAATASCNN